MKTIEKAVTLLMIGAFIITAVAGQRGFTDDKSPCISSSKCFDLSTAEVTRLEENVKNNPQDVDSRSSLIKYYFMKERGLNIQTEPSPLKMWFVVIKNYLLTKIGLNSAAKSRKRHVLWMIQNHPEAEIVGTPFAQFMPFFDSEAYDEGKKAWLLQVEANKSNPVVLGYAAQYFMIFDRDRAEDLLIKAQAMDPKNSQWSEQLGRLYALQMFTSSTDKRKKFATQSLVQLEMAYGATNNDDEKFYMLSDLANAAFGAGEFKKADTYARKLLIRAASYRNNWNYGNAIFKGNMILGRLALRANDVARAKMYLVEAGKTPGSPQLDSFGPNMILAKELLEKGERDAVVEYFLLCSKFWKMDRGVLAEWTSTVKKGGMPNFGRHVHE